MQDRNRSCEPALDEQIAVIDAAKCLTRSQSVLQRRFHVRHMPSSSFLLVCFISLLVRTAPADRPAESSVAPLFGLAGECVLQADLASAKLDEAWHNIKGSWEVKDGTLYGLQLPEQNHAAVLRHELAIHDFIAEFQFKFDSGKAIKLVINKDTVHIATVAIWPGELTVDKQPERNSGKQIQRLDSQKVHLSTDEWHTAVIEVIGDTIVSVVDQRLCVFGSDAGLDIDKTDFDFAANGSTMLKAIKFLKATPPADVEAAKGKLRAFREANK